MVVMRNFFGCRIRFSSLLLCLLCFTAQAKPLTHVVLMGLKGKPKENAVLRLAELEKRLTTQGHTQLRSHFIKQIPSQISEAIQPYGYFRADIKTHLREQSNTWVVVCRVQPGPQLPVRYLHIQVTGQAALDPAFHQLLRRIPLAVGAPFSSSAYEKTKEALFSLASSRGYFEARLTRSKVWIYVKPYYARIALDFDSGPRYVFGPIEFSKVSLNPSLLQRYLSEHSAGVFTSKALQKSRLALLGSGYFRQVVVRTKTENKGGVHRVRIKYRLREKDRQFYTLGLGVNSDLGPRGSVSADYPAINRWGHQVNALLQVAKSNQMGLLNYKIPGHNPTKEQYVFSLQVAHDDEEDNQKFFNQLLSLGYQRSFWGWRQTVRLNFLNEQYHWKKLPRIDTHLMYPSIEWERSHVDDMLRPMKGYRLNLQLAGTHGHLPWTATGFFQATVHGKFLWSFRKMMRFLLRGQVGTTMIHDLYKLPLSHQFLIGGVDTVRGFSYQSIGNDTPGHHMFVASAELQPRLWHYFYGSVFYDSGNVSDHITRHIYRSAGFGMVWLSPVGSVALSLARPLAPHNLKKQWLFQFRIGPDL